MRRKMRGVAALLLIVLMALTAWSGMAEQPGEDRVDAFLAQQAESQKDVWVKAILSAGAQNISWEGDTAAFFLRGFDPGLKELGAYAKAADKAAWRAKAAENIQKYNLGMTLTFEADGTANKKSANNLINAVKKAAGMAKGSIGKKDWTDAMTDMLFCVPATDSKNTAASLMTVDDTFSAFISSRADLYPCESPSEWAPLFYLQRAWKYNVNQGPHHLKLSWDGADPAKFLNQAYDNTTAVLAGTAAADRPKEDSLPYLWRSSLAEAAVKAKKGRLSSWSVEFDLDALISGTVPEEYSRYISGYVPAEYYQRLLEGYHALPEAAALALPKTGVISQAKKGRTVTVRVAKDGRNTYVQLRDADTSVIQAEAFIAPGKNVSLKVPEGIYTVQYATGSTWYGTVDTFGPLGSYTASNEFIVAKKKWTLTSEEDQAGVTLHTIVQQDMAPTEDKSIHIIGSLETDVSLKDDYPEVNPVISGESPLTGLPASGEAYTPILMVLDNAEDAYPHWGVSQADIIFQIPNAGSGATKLMALFANQYPEQAGPVRSGRSSMLPVALSFDAAFAFAGPPAITGGQVDLLAVMQQYGMSRTHRVYNLLSSNGYGERVKGIGSHNLSCHISAIHENLISQGTEFEARPFLFTDEARTSGKTANIIRVLHRGEDPNGGSNSASRAVFKYDAASGQYTRDNSSGTYVDRETGEVVTFANVIVLRVKMAYDRNYIYLNKHMLGSGCAEIFQNGKYVRGAWVREDVQGRLILADENGEELQLQRGRSFIVITNDVTDVIYTE